MEKPEDSWVAGPLISPQQAQEVVKGIPAAEEAPTPEGAVVAPSISVEGVDASDEKPANHTELAPALESVIPEKSPASDGKKLPVPSSVVPSQREKQKEHAAKDNAVELEQTM